MTVIQNRPPVTQTASEPFDPTDKPRFGQLNETAKDAFRKELTDFFDYTTSDGTQKIAQVPNIQKFAYGTAEGDAGLETVVNHYIAYGDSPDKFPMISITSSNQRERSMNLGGNFATNVQYPPTVYGANEGPFNFSTVPGEPSITIRTTPAQGVTQDSLILFDETLFADYSNITVDELVKNINASQALYYTCINSDGKLGIFAGGAAAYSERNSIEIVGGNSDILNILGFSIGDSADYRDDVTPMKFRYSMAADMVINIDVITDSINTRVELSDLVFTFFAYYMEEKGYELLGRGYFDKNFDKELWHISLKRQFSWSAEVNRPRQGGEQYEHIYAMRGSVPIFIEDFIDKQVIEEPVWVDSTNLTPSTSEINGDYFQTNYKK